jgi:hypothetical protein
MHRQLDLQLKPFSTLLDDFLLLIEALVDLPRFPRVQLLVEEQVQFRYSRRFKEISHGSAHALYASNEPVHPFDDHVTRWMAHIRAQIEAHHQQVKVARVLRIQGQFAQELDEIVDDGVGDFLILLFGFELSVLVETGLEHLQHVCGFFDVFVVLHKHVRRLLNNFDSEMVNGSGKILKID